MAIAFVGASVAACDGEDPAPVEAASAARASEPAVTTLAEATGADDGSAAAGAASSGEGAALPAASAASPSERPLAAPPCEHADCAACPAPSVEVTRGEPQWSRDPETGNCCPYAAYQAAPPSWPHFATEEECRSDCRCSSLEGFLEDVGLFATARSTLECRCAAGDCPATPEAAIEALEADCNPLFERAVRRREGCGRLEFTTFDGLYGDSWVFEVGDAGAPVLVGSLRAGDVNFAPCETYVSIAGQSFDCEEYVECLVCGQYRLPLPSCE